MARKEGAGLRSALAACRSLMGWTVLFSAGINLLYLAPTIFMMQVYDRVLTTGGITTLVLMSVILVFALGTLALLDRTRMRLAARMGLRLDRIVSPMVAAAALQGTGREPGRAQAARDFDTFRQVLTSPVATAFLDTPWTIVFVGVAFVIHPLIGAATLVGGVVLTLIALRHEHVMHPNIVDTAQLTARYYAGAEGDRAASEAVRALGMRQVLVRRQLERRRELLAAQTHATFTQSSYGSLSRFWRLVLQSAVLGLGAYLAIERQISPGSLIAGSILTSRALAPLEQIVAGWRQIEQARIAYGNLVKLIDEAPPERPHTALPAPRGEVRFESVSVRIPETNRAALQSVSFALAPGEMLGIVGPSGAGKSTLARAAVGALPLERGTVRLDGANLADWEPDALGQHIGYMPQDLSLLAGTVGENIRRFAPASAETDDMTIAAARAAGAHELILRLPNAYDTPLGLGGRGLSLGQSQRVALARALFGNPKLIVLDEPNAHLDGDGEVALVAAMRQAASRGATVMVVAHKRSIIAVVSKLLLLSDGAVEAFGARDEVARKFMRVVDSANNLSPLPTREKQQ